MGGTIVIIIVVLYLVAMLLIGVYSSKKISNSNDFALAGRNLGPVLLAGTLAATNIGGGTSLGLAEQAFGKFGGVLDGKFDEDADLELLNGRFGPYIAYKKKNYKLPKNVEPASLSFADCMKIIEDADKAPAKKRTIRKKTTK